MLEPQTDRAATEFTRRMDFQSVSTVVRASKNDRLEKHPTKRMSRRLAYTLLELLLALGLTVIIVTLIGNAIFVNMLSLTRVQSSIERKLAARGVLGMLQNDIRAGIQFKAADYSGLQDLFASIQTATGAAGLLDTVDGEAILSGEIPDTATAAASPSFTAGENDLEENLEGVPVFIGAPNSLTIDISRLPRIDEYHPSMPSIKDRVSTIADVKTVSYFVNQSNGPRAEKSSLMPSPFTGGLFRRSVDRSVAAYQGLSDTQEPDEFSELVAPEVVEVAFRYFDGQNWQTDWDSEDENGFPLAVEINLVIDPIRTVGSGATADGGQTRSDRDSLEHYRVVVHLPVAEIVDPEDS